MTISVAGTPPSAPTETNGGTSVSRDCGTCAIGELLNIKVSGVSDNFTPTAGQVTQTSGGGTLGAASLDVSAIGNNGDGGYTFSAQWSAIVTASGTITVTAAGFPPGSFLSISHLRIPSTVGWDSSRVAGRFNGQHTATDGASALSTGNATSTAEAIFVAGLALNNGASVTVTTPGGWTAITDNGANGASAEVLAHAYRIETSGGTHACAWTFTALDGSSYNGQAATVVAYQEAAPTTALEQEGFRFGRDDGAENAHAWEAAQDANITAPAGQTRVLNVLVNVTGDPGTKTVTIGVRKVGEPTYAQIPVKP